MISLIKLLSRASGRAKHGDLAEAVPHLTTGGEQITVNGLPPATELVRQGNSFWAITATAPAPVVAIPTTAALLGLHNFDNEKSIVIDSVFVVVVAVTAAVQAMGILLNVSQLPVGVAIADTIAVKTLRAGGKYGGNAKVAVGITLDGTSGVAANWQPWGTSPAPSNTLQVGETLDAPVDGKIILPPKGLLGVSVLSGAATATSIQVGVRWHEVLLPLP